MKSFDVADVETLALPNRMIRDAYYIGRSEGSSTEGPAAVPRRGELMDFSFRRGQVVELEKKYARTGSPSEVEILEDVNIAVPAFRIRGHGEIELLLAGQHEDTALL